MVPIVKSADKAQLRWYINNSKWPLATDFMW